MDLKPGSLLASLTAHAADVSTHGQNAIAGISSGSYAGNNTVNRAIPHGLGVIPKVVFIVNQPSALNAINHLALGFIWSSSSNNLAVTGSDATNFYVGNATSYPNSGNATTRTYDWIAIG